MGVELLDALPADAARGRWSDAETVAQDLEDLARCLQVAVTGHERGTGIVRQTV